MTDDVLFSTDRNVGRIRLNRPKAIHALTREMCDAMSEVLLAWREDPSIQVVVIDHAEGRGFCAGGDVTAMGDASALAAMTMEQKVDRQRAVQRFSGLLHAIPKITLVAINGPCAGAGFGIALACDLRLAADSAKLTTAFAKVGFSGDFGITWPLVRTLGSAKALELLLLSDVLSAADALQLGLLNRVVPAAELMTAARSLAAQLAVNAPIAMRYIINAVTMGLEMPLAEGCAFEASLFGLAAATDDMREGTRAFLEKRKAEFTGK